MYRSCENANDDDPVTEALEILRAVTKKIKREHTPLIEMAIKIRCRSIKKGV